MSMTYQQFVEHATDLKKHSDSIDDGWNFREYRCPVNESRIRYLVKKHIQKMNESSLKSDHSEHKIPIVCEYHILYNPSYSCPDVFFNMWYTDGKLLSLEHIWSLVHYFIKESVVHDKWNAITQEMHPFSSTPFFRLHPCKNTHVLEMLGFSSKNNYEFNPLIAWLSTISPLIGLEIHLSYGNKDSKVEFT
ncbi:ubiquitin-like-conjugating enzyme ATG10 isoform X2 [Rhopalosiphum padi]|uniref:ubiquitin-like-conjugating enzyme ATG10 isoform X2 n=1 Tax=Rhopalosiphum padi TaxID=40932 RepID=UPI00298EB9E5|nr:ubiquitin-like-conjugating enzyme ATG10 isoform X2 [Rhopalosiphum padi]